MLVVGPRMLILAGHTQKLSRNRLTCMHYSLTNNQPIIISLGGSLFSRSEGADVAYIKTFIKEIRQYVSKGYRFVIVTGGGMGY